MNQIIHIDQHLTTERTQPIDTDWLNYFSPAAALKTVAAHVAGLDGSSTPEKHTARAYESGLRYFLAWLSNSPVDTGLHELVHRPLPIPTEDVLLRFKAHLRATGRKPNTISTKYFAPVRHWLRALVKQHIPGLSGDTRDQVEDYRLALHSALEVKVPHKKKKGGLYHHGTRLRVDQINDLFSHTAADDSLAGLRDIALIYLGITSALRVAEIQRLTLSNIRSGETAPYEIVVRGKRGHTDPVAVDAATVRLIYRWVEAFNASLVFGKEDPRYIHDHTPIWQPLRKGRPESLHNHYDPTKGITLQGVREIIARRAKAAIGIDITPHDLRRTYAARADEAGIDLTVISRQMRHQNVATTADYIGHRENLGAALLTTRINFEVPA